jgi:hypothetical protein
MSSLGPLGGVGCGDSMLAQPKTTIKTTPQTTPAAVRKKAGFFILILSAENPANYMRKKASRRKRGKHGGLRMKLSLFNPKYPIIPQRNRVK